MTRAFDARAADMADRHGDVVVTACMRRSCVSMWRRCTCGGMFVGSYKYDCDALLSVSYMIDNLKNYVEDFYYFFLV